MALFVNDPFSGTPGDNLSAYNGWAKVAGVTGDAIIASTGDRLRFSGATLYYLGSATPPSADYSATIELYIASTTSGPGVGVAVRLSSTAQTYYLARLLLGTGIQLYRVSNGSSTLLGSASYAATVGNTLRLRLDARGAAQNVYLDDATAASITAADSVITEAGYVGIRAINAASQLLVESITADDGQEAGVAVSGSFSSGIAPLTMSAAGVVLAGGTFASHLEPVTMSASGVAGSGTSGTFASALAPVTASFAGTLANRGAFEASLAPVTMSASGTASNRGTFAASVAPVTMNASGSLAMNVSAILDSTLDPVTFAAGGYVGQPPEMAGFFQRLPKNPRHYLPLQ